MSIFEKIGEKLSGAGQGVAQQVTVPLPHRRNSHTWLLSRSFGSPAARMTSLVHHPMQGAALP